jgi:hypothetical protein
MLPIRLTYIWAVLVLVISSLLAQGPPPEKFHEGQLIKITADSESHDYSYTIMAGCGYVGRSSTVLKLHANSNVKFAIERESLYIIDEDGKVQQTRYVLQFLPPPPPPPRK